MNQWINDKVRSHIAAMLMIAGLVLVFSIRADHFFTWTNLINILTQTAPMCILAIGLTFVVIGGNLDLSGGAVIAFVGVVCGEMLTAGFPVWVVFPAGLALGALVGLFNGACVAYLEMPAFILTMATQIIVRGLAYAISGGGTIYGLPQGFLQLGSGWFLSIPISVWLLVVLFPLGHLLLEKTILGYRIYAVGENLRGARLAGIADRKVRMSVFVLSGVFYALAAIVLTGQLGAAVSTSGDGMEMTALACLAIGGISLSGGRGDLIGTFLGCLIIGILSNGVNMLNMSPYYTNIIRGMVIFGALAIECGRIYLIEKRKREEDV